MTFVREYRVRHGRTPRATGDVRVARVRGAFEERECSRSESRVTARDGAYSTYIRRDEYYDAIDSRAVRDTNL